MAMPSCLRWFPRPVASTANCSGCRTFLPTYNVFQGSWRAGTSAMRPFGGFGCRKKSQSAQLNTQHRCIYLSTKGYILRSLTFHNVQEVAVFMTRIIQVPSAPTTYLPHGSGMRRNPTAVTQAAVTGGVKKMNHLGNLVFRVATTYAIQKEATITAGGPGV